MKNINKRHNIESEIALYKSQRSYKILGLNFNQKDHNFKI